MDNFIERMRNAFRRTADRMTGQHVPVQTNHAAIEDLENRRLSTPTVDILENDKEVMIVADTPGAFPDNTKLHWDEREGLSLYVQRGDGRSDGWLWDQSFGEDWCRAFALPEYVDANEARAVVRGGVLTIQIPKRAIPKPVTIPVTAS